MNKAIVSYSPSKKEFSLIQGLTGDFKRQEEVIQKIEENIKACNSDELIIEIPEWLIDEIK